MKQIMKKDEGFIQYAFCIMLISICSLVMLYSLRMRIVQEQKQYIEDGLVASVLASATIDINEYGTYGYIRSGSNNTWDEEEIAMLNKFVENLAINLDLHLISTNSYTLTPNTTNTIITSDMEIMNYWIYCKDLENIAGKVIQNYNGDWVLQHKETNNWRIFKFTRNTVNGISIGSVYTGSEKAVKENGFVYTPLDSNVITKDANGYNSGTGDGAGKGHVKVDSGMTIYCTIQFKVNPFGYNSKDNNTGGLFGVGSLVSDTTVTKSVVVTVDKK